jgi:hypothetical protein
MGQHISLTSPGSHRSRVSHTWLPQWGAAPASTKSVMMTPVVIALAVVKLGRNSQFATPAGGATRSATTVPLVLSLSLSTEWTVTDEEARPVRAATNAVSSPTSATYDVDVGS